MQKQLRREDKKDKERNQDKFVSIGDAEKADADKILHDMNKALGVEMGEPPAEYICYCGSPPCRVGPFVTKR